jgi:DNA-binding CsgD family transcriptional regulator
MDLRPRPHAPVAVPDLSRLGCSIDADLVYRALCLGGPASVRRLSAALGLPRHRIDKAVAELRAAGCVTRSDTGPASGWVARPPAEVLGRLSERRRRPGDAAARAIRHRRALEVIGGPQEIGDGVRYLPSRELTRQRVAELMTAARHEHLAMHTERRFAAEAVRAAAPLDRGLRERDVQLRVIGLPAVPEETSLYLASGGVPPLPDTFRETANVPLKLIVIDRRHALFPADPNDLDRGYLEIAQPPMVNALVTLFEREWDTASLPAQGSPPRLLLTQRERALVRLLAAGHTNASAAAEMRLGVRTVTNIVRGLMEQHHVRSRFQLGLALGALGVAVDEGRIHR